MFSSSVLYELIGPACAKLSLALSHSYDKNAPEDKVKVLSPKEEDKLIVNLLISRIREIQNELPKHEAIIAAQTENNQQIIHPGLRHSHQNNINFK